MIWFREQQKAEAAARRDEFAELVSQGMTLRAAGEQMGISFQRASQIWKRICEDLGWQACVK